MALNATMLSECKEVIYNKCNLPDSVKEPIHLATKALFALEYSYEDFLSREMAGEIDRFGPIELLISLHGGDIILFREWYEKYEVFDVKIGMRGAWGT